MKTNHSIDEWGLVSRFFPKGWEDRAKELGAITRLRKIKSASELLRLLLIHIAGGCSLREASTRAKHGGIATISDVGLLKRLRASSEWFRWMSIELLSKRGVKLDPPNWLARFNVRTVDASVVSEPGSTGTDWRLHYSMRLYSLQCDQFLITRQETGESFLNFDICKDDLIIGDRAYGRLKGMKHVKNNGGHYIVRLKNKAFKMYNSNGIDFSILNSVKNLSIGKVQDLEVYADSKDNKRHREIVRLCIIRKSVQRQLFFPFGDN